jgi:hypothetical protein
MARSIFAAGETALRDGPGSGYRALGMLAQFDGFQVIGGLVGGGWLAVSTVLESARLRPRRSVDPEQDFAVAAASPCEDHRGLEYLRVRLEMN